jgi:hypothetical protein
LSHSSHTFTFLTFVALLSNLHFSHICRISLTTSHSSHLSHSSHNFSFLRIPHFCRIPLTPSHSSHLSHSSHNLTFLTFLIFVAFLSHLHISRTVTTPPYHILTFLLPWLLSPLAFLIICHIPLRPAHSPHPSHLPHFHICSIYEIFIRISHLSHIRHPYVLPKLSSQSFALLIFVAVSNIRHLGSIELFIEDQAFLAVVWVGSSLTPSSAVSKLDRRHTGRLRKRNNFLTGE